MFLIGIFLPFLLIISSFSWKMNIQPRDDPDVTNFTVYIFNITNPEEIFHRAQPVAVEVGPYIYKQTRLKTVTSEDDETVTYSESFTLEFDQDASAPFTEQDLITTLNIPFNSLLQAAEDSNTAIGGIIDQIFPETYNSFFVDISVRDLLFNGLKFCDNSGDNDILTNACNKISESRNVDSSGQGLSFSYFSYKIGEPGEVYTVNKATGEIVALNGESATSIWGAEDCDAIKGGDGTTFPANIDQNMVSTIYFTDICRSIDFYFWEETIYGASLVYKFAPANNSLKVASPEESCFCSGQTKGIYGDDSCFLNGVLDLQPCTGLPVLMSFPHFLWADGSYALNIANMQSDEEKHESLILVEPTSGNVLQLAKRIQINAVARKLKPEVEYHQTDDIIAGSGVVIPLFWVEEGFQ